MRAVVIMTICLVACGGELGPPDATVDASDENSLDVGVNDASAEAPPFLKVVEGGGDAPWCKPDPYDPFQSCCNGEYCKGFCIATEDGGLGCSCFGIQDGCNGMTAIPQWRVICEPKGCVATNCLPGGQICGASLNCCDPDQYCDIDAGDGGTCVNYQ